MRIESFEWNARNAEHIARHNVHDYEVEEVILFDKPIYYRARDKRYLAYGFTQDGRYLFVAFVVIGRRTIRVITSRDMSLREKRNYRRKR